MLGLDDIMLRECLVQRLYFPTAAVDVITLLGNQKVLSKCRCDHHPPEGMRSCRAPFNSLEMVANCGSCKHIPEVPPSLNSSVLLYFPQNSDNLLVMSSHLGDHCEAASSPLGEPGDGFFPSQDGRFEEVNSTAGGLLAQEGS